MANYKLARNRQEILDYLEGAKVVGFDFETAPNEEYRNDPTRYRKLVNSYSHVWNRNLSRSLIFL